MEAIWSTTNSSMVSDVLTWLGSAFYLGYKETISFNSMFITECDLARILASLE